MCSLEFNLLEMMDRAGDLSGINDIMKKVFRTKLLFLDMDPMEYEDHIEKGIAVGKEIPFILYSSTDIQGDTAID